MAPSLFLKSGSVTTLLRSALTLLMIGAGVPSGATITCQPVAEKPGIVSATVGRSGNSGRRSADATAITLTDPALTAATIPEYPLDDHRNAAANDIAERWRRTARIGNGEQFDIRPHLQQFAGQVREPADAGHRNRNFFRVLFGERDKLRQRRDAERGTDRDEHRIFGREADRQEVARQLQRQIRRNRRQRRERR